jgi:hypothetical protein
MAMLISQVIAQLTQLLEKHGDLEVTTYHDSGIQPVARIEADTWEYSSGKKTFQVVIE